MTWRRQPSTAWLPAHYFQAKKANIHLIKIIFILLIKDSREKRVNKTCSVKMHTFSILPTTQNSSPSRTSREKPGNALQVTHSYSSTLPLHCYMSLTPGLIWIWIKTDLSSSSLLPPETLLLPSATVMPNPNQHGCLLPLRTISAWGRAKDLTLPCMEIIRVIPLGLVWCFVPKTYSRLITW